MTAPVATDHEVKDEQDGERREEDVEEGKLWKHHGNEV
jgi:hypothetical protein